MIIKSGAICLSAIQFMIITGCISSRSIGHSELFANDSISLPKTLYLARKAKKLLYMGTYHSNDPKDLLFTRIKNEFRSFDPELVLYEGTNWPIYSNLDSTIIISGEPGYLISLSKEKGISAISIEPHETDEYRSLLKKNSLDWVVLMYLCRQIDQQQRYINLHKTRDEQFEKNIAYFLTDLKRNGVPLNVYQLEYVYWRKKYLDLLNKELNWRTFDPREYYPNFHLTKMNEINRLSDEFRNQHMIKTIKKNVKKYDKVMVVVGGGHLIVQEKALRYALKKWF